MMKRTVTTMVLGILLFAVPYAMAETVNVTVNEGKWGTATGGTVNGTFNYNGKHYGHGDDTVKYSAGDTIISWGIPYGSGGPQSAYGWAANNTISPVTVGEEFVLGTFTHYNNPLLSSFNNNDVKASITSVNLNLQFGTFENVLTPGPLTFDLTFEFLHNETPAVNNGPNPPDIVNITGPTYNNEFAFEGEIYYFSLLGFKDGDYKNTLWLETAEGENTSRELYAIITSIPIPPPTPNEIPEPGSILLLGTGIVGLGFVVRRKLVKK